MEITKEFLEQELVNMERQSEQLIAQFHRANGMCGALKQLIERCDQPEPEEEPDVPHEE